jgi:hypothetical protein
MKPLICAMVAGVLLGGATIGVDEAEAGGRKHRKYRAAYDDRYYYDDDHYDRGRYFTHREVYLVREYYRPRYRALPPGLRRHYYRRGYLPPGWHHRIEPYPAYMRDVVVLPRGYHRGVIDGHAVIYNSRGMIIDLAVLF